MATAELERDRTHIGDVSKILGAMARAGVKAQAIVTSPPYWGLRDYDVEGQIGLEPTIGAYIKRVVRVFQLARHVLADDGVLWLNMGDSYYTDHVPGGVGVNSTINSTGTQEQAQRAFHARKKRNKGNTLQSHDARAHRSNAGRLKHKDLIGQPWRLALALQAAGWYLRCDVVWHKPNPMPESVSDRPTKSHEYVFLLSKSERYYYDADAIKEPVTGNAHTRGNGLNAKVAGWMDGAGSHSTIDHARGEKDDGREAQGLKTSTKFGRGKDWRNKQNASMSAALAGGPPSERRAKYDAIDDRIAGSNMLDSTRRAREETGERAGAFGTYRNARSVWSIPTEKFSGAHFATFPRELVRRCILAGTKPGDVVLDIFHGTGTTGEVALSLGRHFYGIELNPKYVQLGADHRSTQKGLCL